MGQRYTIPLEDTPMGLASTTTGTASPCLLHYNSPLTAAKRPNRRRALVGGETPGYTTRSYRWRNTVD
jgi:hypothetical protein